MKRIKKAFAFILSVCIAAAFLSAFPALAVEGTSFTASSASGEPGSKVDIDLILDKGCSAVTLRIFMKYDQSAVKATYYKWKESMTIGQRSISAKNGNVLVTGLTYDGSSALSKPGVIVTVTFEILKDAKEGEYPIELFINSGGDLVSNNYEAIPFTLNNGKITVTNSGASSETEAPTESETNKEDNKPKPSEDYEFNTDINDDIVSSITDKIDGGFNPSDITNVSDQTTNISGQTTNPSAANPSDKKNVAVVEILKKFGVDNAGDKITMEIPDAVKKADNIQVYKYDIQTDTLVPVNDSVIKGDLIEFDSLDEGYYVFAEDNGKSKSPSPLKIAITAGAVLSLCVIAAAAALLIKNRKKESSDETAE